MYSGGTKKGELDRTAELFKQILDEQGAYFALMFLVDAGYDRNDIELIAERIKPKKPAKLEEKIKHGFNCLCPATFCCSDDDEEGE